MKKFIFSLSLAWLFATQMSASFMLLPMDAEQQNHLKAYGITYWVISNNVEAWWLLNYRGGSFAFPHTSVFEKECKIRGVSYEVIPDGSFNHIINEINHPEINQEAVKLKKRQKSPFTPHRRLQKPTG